MIQRAQDASECRIHCFAPRQESPAPHKRDNVSGRTLGALQLNDTGEYLIETVIIPNVTLQRQHYHGLFGKIPRLRQGL